jgi:hypothetical protein
MTIFQRISITLAALLLVAAGVSVHHQYEQHLSSGYAPIFKAAMTGSYEERAQYIHEARVAMRTDKDRETEAKLERWQQNFNTQYDVDDMRAAYTERAKLWIELCAVAGVSPYPMPG